MIKGGNVININEYIVEYDPKANCITRIVVVIERCQCSVLDLILKEWGPYPQKFSYEKFFYIMTQSVEAIYDLNINKGIYYGDMKPANLLVTRGQSIRIGDFGVSIKFQDDVEMYELKDITPDMGLKSLEVSFKSKEEVTKEVLLKNDLECTINSFSRPY